MILNFDESGNLGTSGRYFTIACVCADNMKPLKNTMSKSFLKVKNQFTQFKDEPEVKAKDSNPIIKDYILRKIMTKDIQIRYIVADKIHVKQQLLDDENLLYNYMLQFLIVPVAKQRRGQNLILNLDQRSIKVKSINSFADYIKLELNYRHSLDINIEVNYFESQNNFSIQAADFIANAINTKYEYNYNYYYDIIRSKIVHNEQFPRKLFGTNKVVGIHQGLSNN